MLQRHPLWWVFAVALGSRLMVAVGIAAFTDGFMFPDAQTYSDMAAAVAQGRAGAWDDYTRFLYDATAAFTLPLTAIYSLVGPKVLAGQMLVAVMGALTAVGATRVALEVLTPGASTVAGMIVALLPSQVLFSALTLKDAFVWACLVGVSAFAAASQRMRGRALVMSPLVLLALLLVLAHLRAHTLVMTCWALALCAFASQRERVARVAVAVSVAVLLPWAMGMGVGGSRLVSAAGNLEGIRVANAVGAATAIVKPPPPPPPPEVVRRVQRRVEEAEVEAAQVAQEAEALRAAAASGDPAAQRQLAVIDKEVVEARERLLEAERQAQAAAAELQRASGPVAEPAAGVEIVGTSVRHLPRGLSVMLLEPFPWAVRENPRLRMAALEMLLWYPLLALGAIGVAAVRRHPEALLLPLVLAGGVAVMYGLAEGNFGTAYRHRGELVWVIAVFAAAGAEDARCRIAGRRRRLLVTAPAAE